MPRPLPLLLFALHLFGGAGFLRGQEPKPPALPAAAENAEIQSTRERLKKTGATTYELDGIKIDAASREVRVPTKVNLKQAPIEYMLVHETGKTHESVLSTEVSPTSIQLALLLAHYQPATQGMLEKVPEAERPKIWGEAPPASPRGNRLRLDVEWQNGGKTKRSPLSDWYQNVETRKPPLDVPSWIFNGSFVDERGFVATHEGSIIAVWLDRGAIINSPAEGAWRDDLWISLPANIPDEGTPVTLIFTPEAPNQK